MSTELHGEQQSQACSSELQCHASIHDPWFQVSPCRLSLQACPCRARLQASTHRLSLHVGLFGPGLQTSTPTLSLLTGHCKCRHYGCSSARPTHKNPGSSPASKNPNTMLGSEDPSARPAHLLTQTPSQSVEDSGNNPLGEPSGFLDGLTSEELSMLKPFDRDWKSSLLLQIHRHQHKVMRITSKPVKKHDTIKEIKS